MECYNALYIVLSDLSFYYTTQTLSTQAEQTYTITITAGQYVAADIESTLSGSLYSRMTFTYNSQDPKRHRQFPVLGTLANAWVSLYLKFAISTEGEHVSSYTSSTIATLMQTAIRAKI
jgi:hypothetical protein